MRRTILAAGKSSRTARLSRGVLRAALRHAERQGRAARNVAALSEPVKAEHREKRSMSVEQVRKLISAAAGARNEAAIVVVVTLGLRRGELLALQWSDIDLKADTLHVSRALKRTENDLEAFARKTEQSKRRFSSRRSPRKC